MITEKVMAEGSFEIKFGLDAPLSLYSDLTRFGHIVITPQQIDPKLIGDAGVLAIARYSGVLLRRTLGPEGLTLYGAGMSWWLGDSEGRGDVYESQVSLSGVTLSSALSSLLPSAITSGTVTDGSLPTYTGDHIYETPLAAIRTVMLALGAEFKVQPDGTIDAGASDDVFNTAAPTVVVVRRQTGSDPIYDGVFTRTLESQKDATPYVTRVIYVADDGNNTLTLVDTLDRASVTEYDIHGNLIDRVLKLQANSSDNAISVATYLTSELNRNAEIQNQNVTTDQYEITGGSWQVGDAFWCYDPPVFEDTDNQIHFRGDVIHPVSLRLLSATWPIRRGMGVYFRPPSSSVTGADYVELTDWVQWEDGASTNPVLD